MVTLSKEGFVCSTVPLLFLPNVGDHGVLQGHLARENPQWRSSIDNQVLVIVRGPDAYVSPSYYPSAKEHGEVVPTWNYTTIHAYGTLSVHDDLEWKRSLVRRLTEHHESSRSLPWTADDAPAAFVADQLHAVVGIQVEISRIEAKWKLSQNRSTQDTSGVVAGLLASGDPRAEEVARLMRDVLS